MRRPPSVAALSGCGFRLSLFRGGRRSSGGGGLDRDLVLDPLHGDPRAVLFDRDLRDPGLLHDPDDLPDALGPRLVDVPTEQRLLAARAVADRLQERLCLLSEERQQEQLLLARGEALRVLANVVELERLLDFVVRAGDERDGPLDGRVDLPRWSAETPLEQIAQLVDDRLVAGRRENVDDRLRREDLADRCGNRRRTGLAADHGQLVEDVVEAVGGPVRAEPGVDCRDEARRQLVLGGAHRDPRREGGDRIVADELVDHLRGLPEDADVDSTVHPSALRARWRPLRRRHGAA